MAREKLSFEIVETMAVLATSPKGWTKEVNIIKWGDHEAKVDIRDWAPDHEKCGKGITLTDEEVKTLVDTLKKKYDL